MLCAVRIVSANVNGVRAAARRGGLAWLAGSGADVICLQEVRATPEQLSEALAGGGLGAWSSHHGAGPRSGHAGVAILVRPGLRATVGDPAPEELSGRWITATVGPAGPQAVVVASAYVHTGAADGPAWRAKQDFLAHIGAWMAEHGEVRAVLTGDLNVAHTADDIKNWRGNRGKAGFLASERAHFDHWFASRPEGLGWVDLGRRFAGPRPGPYTWWSWRGRGFDNDSGWRIDYLIASPDLAPAAAEVRIARAASYEERWSDHAAVILDLAD